MHCYSSAWVLRRNWRKTKSKQSETCVINLNCPQSTGWEFFCSTCVEIMDGPDTQAGQKKYWCLRAFVSFLVLTVTVYDSKCEAAAAAAGDPWEPWGLAHWDSELWVQLPSWAGRPWVLAPRVSQHLAWGLRVGPALLSPYTVLPALVFPLLLSSSSFPHCPTPHFLSPSCQVALQLLSWSFLSLPGRLIPPLSRRVRDRHCMSRQRS